jgi:two-component system sensor histidine kinase TtrS
MVTFPTVTPDTSRRILGALVETGEVDGNYWSIATDFSRLDRLLRTLELDDFSLFRRSFVSTMWARWRDVVLLALLVIIGLAAHSVRTRLVVRRQTSELRRLLDEQKRLHEQARVSSKRIEKLQRLGAMGQMSSLFAHELRQPLNSVICYAYSLLQRNDQIYADQTIHEGLSEIRSQAERADAIVRRVRSYVKSQSESLQNMILKDIIDKAIREFETSQPRHVPIRIQADPGIRVLADPLEMELVIINLLRNASEVQKDADDALIVVSLERTESSARLRIQDNGPQLTAQSVLRIQQSEDSTKPEGLGLGLSIVRMLVEKHNGTIRFAPGRRRGLVVTITLPLAPEIASGEES